MLPISNSNSPPVSQEKSVQIVQRLCRSLGKYTGNSSNALTLGRVLAETSHYQGTAGREIKFRATQCFGILHPKFHPLHDRALFRWFLVNFPKSSTSQSKIEESLRGPEFWKHITECILQSPGLSAEVFLLYSLLERKSYLKKRGLHCESTRHFQSPKVFDDKEKLDLVTQIFSRDHSQRHNVGVQITTSHIHARWIGKKEKIFASIPRNSDPKEDRFSPQSGCFIVINDAIGRVEPSDSIVIKNSSQSSRSHHNRRHNFYDEKKRSGTNPYQDAFVEWSRHKYDGKGILHYLPNYLSDNYRVLTEIYEHAFKAYQNVIFSHQQNMSSTQLNIGGNTVHCRVSKKENSFILSYFTVQQMTRRNRRNGIPPKTTFLASFTFYPPEAIKETLLKKKNDL